MGKSFLLFFWRKISKGDIYSLINLFGLMMGIAACLMIFLYVADELSYDKHHHNAPNTYRLLMDIPSKNSTVAIMPAIMHEHLVNRIPSMHRMGRVQLLMHEMVISRNNKVFVEKGMALADPEILDIFSFEFLQGNPQEALSEPSSIILTQDAAMKYFGDENPVGQSLLFENDYTFVVTAVISPLPLQSHLQFSMMGSLEAMRTINPSAMTDWGNQAMYFYMQLTENADPSIPQEQITQIIWEANSRFKDRIYYKLQPLLDIRLKSKHIEWDMADTGSIVVVRVFSFIALLILILACFNFVNLSLALSLKRSKEIGIKKTLGAGRNQLIRQFLAETFFMAFISLLLAGVLTELALPALNALTGKSLALNFFSAGQVIPFLILLLVFVSLSAGLYPAMVITSSPPVFAIRGNQSSIMNCKGKMNFSFRLRQMLMMLQFSVSTALIVVSLAIYVQMHFLNHRSPGFTKEGLIAIRNPMDQHMRSRGVRLKNYLQQDSRISFVSLTHNIPGSAPNNYSTFRVGPDDGSLAVNGALISCDEDLFTTLGAKIFQGRNFSSMYSTDFTQAAIINKAMKIKMGIDDPLNMQIKGFYDNEPRTIIGVVDDIHFTSLHDVIEPMVYYINGNSYPHYYFNILARYESGKSGEIIKLIENFWKEEASAWPLQYHFVEDKLKEQYNEDKKTMNIVMIFAGLAILLSVMGLIGVALHSVSTRTREIGIRKVLGAGIMDIIKTISSEFGILIIISNLIAWPVSWFFVSRWLENFAYRTDIHWYMFVTPSLMIFICAALVMISISYAAASQNPVDTIRRAD
jgi:putative ABC transport system permease protein